MLEGTWPLVLPLGAIAIMIRIMNHEHRPLAAFFLLSSTYYAYLGPGYWINVRSSSFIGVYWGSDEIISAALLLSWSSFSVLVIVQLADWIAPRKLIIMAPNLKNYSANQTPLFVFAIIGALGLVYTSLSVLSAGGFNEGDRFLLIAYQFSDLLIPVALYLVGTKISKTAKIGILSIFLCYALFLGFRYKAILLMAPILSASFMAPDLIGAPSKILRRRSLIIVAGLLLIIGFSLLTLARTKFEGVDINAVKSQNTEDMIYGALAESNIIFGELSIINDFVNQDRSLGLRPLALAAEEWLPRFLFPNKGANSYMEAVLAGLISDEALKSATAYPYIGEYLIIGGYTALPFALLILGLFCRWYIGAVYAGAGCTFHREIGGGLLAVFVGYYYYSRGFLPQALKGVVFVLLPYIYLVTKSAGTYQTTKKI